MKAIIPAIVATCTEEKASALFRGRTAQFFFLYDGDCGVCQRTVAVIDRLNLLEHVEIVDFQRHWTSLREAFPVLDYDACLKDIHLIRRDGESSTGFYAYRTLAWLLPLTWFIAPFLYVPGVPLLGREIYRRVAASRRAGVCALPQQKNPAVNNAVSKLRELLWAGPQVGWALEGLACLLLFFLLEPVFHACSNFNASFYSAPILFYEALKYPRAWVLLVLSLLVLVFWRQYRWSSFELGTKMRWVLAILAVTLGFSFSTYSYNYLFDQPHYLDRGLLMGLSLLTAVHPVFLPLFLLQAYVVTGQFNHPLVYSWTDKILLFQLLALAVAFLPIKLINRRAGFVPYFMVAVSIIAAFYLLPGIGKVQLNWVLTNHTANIVGAAHFQNGWFIIDSSWYDWIREMTVKTDWLLKSMTLAIEVGIVFVLARRWLAAALLAGCALLHVGIFVTSGIFFWKWIVVNFAFGLAILGLREPLTGTLFNSRQLVVGLFFIGFYGFSSPRVVNLAWYDSNMMFHFGIAAIGASGRSYEVPPYMLAPYDLPFAQGRFYFLTSRPQLVDCLGAVRNRELLFSLRNSVSAQEVVAIRHKFGKSVFDEARLKDFDLLMKRYFRWRNDGHRPGGPLHLIASPHHIFTSGRSSDPIKIYGGQEAIDHIEIRLQEAIFREDGISEVIYDDIIHAVQIAETKGAALRAPHARRAEWTYVASQAQ